MNPKFTYLILDIGTIIGPIILSFDQKVNFISRFKNIILSICIPSLVYLIWDIVFTKFNIWKFNYSFLLGHSFCELPIEEYLFFIAVPYACLFIYDCIRIYFPIEPKRKYYNLWIILTVIFGLITFSNIQLTYTFVTFSLLTITLTGLLIQKKELNKIAAPLIISWLVSIIPMFIVNGYLTKLPILIYNNNENLGIRIGTIPIEDFFYNLLYMIWMIVIYNYLNSKSKNIFN